jgi:hypothetical protein
MRIPLPQLLRLASLGGVVPVSEIFAGTMTFQAALWLNRYGSLMNTVHVYRTRGNECEEVRMPLAPQFSFYH